MVRSHAGDHKNECCDPAATTQTPKRFAARMVIMPAHALPTNEPRRLYNLDNPVRCKRYKLLQQIIWASPRLHSFTTGNQLEGHGTILLLSVSISHTALMTPAGGSPTRGRFLGCQEFGSYVESRVLRCIRLANRSVCTVWYADVRPGTCDCGVRSEGTTASSGATALVKSRSIGTYVDHHKP